MTQKQVELNGSLQKNNQIIKDENEMTKMEYKSDYLNQQKQDIQIQPLTVPHHSAYRADIDGLRAVAITLVLIFHGWPTALPGGFVGVDVFFVISGYLISGIILKQAQKNKFSFVDFYSRRIKRIYPALIVTLIVVLIIGCGIYLLIMLQSMASTMAATTVFIANFAILGQERPYFDSQTQNNPLLHMWSLGVEQQFYIIWPFFISIIVKFFHKKVLYILAAFTLFSFGFGLYWSYQNPKFAFYFPICRFWQMSIGGILAYLNLKVQNKWITNALSASGIIAIFITIFRVNQNSLFPGWWALVPTLSSTFIILAGENSYVNKYLLSNKLSVAIGKISYPLYLWHWPFLAFLKNKCVRPFPPTSGIILAALLLAVCLSIITYFFIQKPLRYRKQKIVVYCLVGIMITIGLMSYSLSKYPQVFGSKQKSFNEELARYKQQMMPGVDDYVLVNGTKIPNVSVNKNREPPTFQQFLFYKQMWCQIVEQILFRNSNSITSSSKYYEATKDMPQYTKMFIINQEGSNLIFLIGDSHAQYVIFRFKELYQQSIQKGTSKSFPTIIIIVRFRMPFIKQFEYYEFSMNLLRKYKPKRVLFVNQWVQYFQKLFPQKADAAFIQYANTLLQISSLGIEVSTGLIQPQSTKFEDMYSLYDQNGNIYQQKLQKFELIQFRTKYSQQLLKFETAVNGTGVKMLEFTQNLCWNGVCEKFMPSGWPVFFDFQHFSIVFCQYWLQEVDYFTIF